MPDERDAEGAMNIRIVQKSLPDTSHKRRRKECSVTKNTKRRVVECSEDSYYMKNYPTWRKYPLSLNICSTMNSLQVTIFKQSSSLVEDIFSTFQHIFHQISFNTISAGLGQSPQILTVIPVCV